MPKYTRAQAGQAAIVPAPLSVPLANSPVVPYNLITAGPYGTVYSTSTTLITADGAMIPAYQPAYSLTSPVPAGKGRA